jgi:hypothetical protein
MLWLAPHCRHGALAGPLAAEHRSLNLRSLLSIAYTYAGHSSSHDIAIAAINVWGKLANAFPPIDQLAPARLHVTEREALVPPNSIFDPGYRVLPFNLSQRH